MHKLVNMKFIQTLLERKAVEFGHLKFHSVDTILVSKTQSATLSEKNTNCDAFYLADE